MTKPLDTLLPVARAMEARALSAHRKILTEKSAMQQRIDGLADQVALQPDTGAIPGLQRLGADVAWRDWAARRRAQLLRELAILRAREMESLPKARIALARADALALLAARERQQQRHDDDANQQKNLLALSLLQNAAKFRD